jgi:predicted ATP-binding protein involved in virulence
MQIKRLILKNYKGFRNFDQRFNQHFTLIVGNNATGKTSILDALSVAFGSFLLGIPSARSRTIRQDEANETIRLYDDVEDSVPNFPVAVVAEGVLHNEIVSVRVSENENYKWSRELLSVHGRTTSKGAANIQNFARESYRAITDEKEITLPLLSYYGTGRLWEEPRKISGSKRRSRFDAYKNSHEARVSSKDLLLWIEQERLNELETSRPSERLKAWKSAVENCFEDDVSVNYSAARKRIEVNFKNKEVVVSYDNLSHGQRNILSMVGDIAFKSILLNPHLKENALRITPGIVLIDEIDLHLHPRWQRIIIPALQKSFPEIQFVATTHSPFIVQSLRDGILLNLDDMDVDDDVYNLGILEIVEDIQNVDAPNKSAKHKTQKENVEQFMILLDEYRSLDSAEKLELESKLDSFLENNIEDPGLAALLKVKRLALKKD